MLSTEEIVDLYNSQMKRIDSDNWEFYINKSNISDGTFSVIAYAENNYGISNLSGTRTVTIDTTAPILTFTLPSLYYGYGATSGDKVNIQISSNEELDTCNLYQTPVLSSTQSIFNVTIDQSWVDSWDMEYPVTYEFDIPSSVTNINVYHRNSISDEWEQLTEKTSNDLFNGIEAVRFNYTSNKAYVSVGFNSSNLIQIKFDSFGISYLTST